MKKVYYDKKTGYLCNRYPKDIEKTEDSPFIEVEDEIEEQKPNQAPYERLD